MLNYFDCCANQLVKQTSTPTKEYLQNLFQCMFPLSFQLILLIFHSLLVFSFLPKLLTFLAFQKSLFPVVDVSSIKVFEYIVKQANTHFPVVKTEKAKEEPKSDIYNFGTFFLLRYVLFDYQLLLSPAPFFSFLFAHFF